MPAPFWWSSTANCLIDTVFVLPASGMSQVVEMATVQAVICGTGDQGTLFQSGPLLRLGLSFLDLIASKYSIRLPLRVMAI